MQCLGHLCEQLGKKGKEEQLKKEEDTFVGLLMKHKRNNNRCIFIIDVYL